MSVALVTGASGFIGRHAVSELLEHGFVVHTVSRHPLPHIQANWHKVDLFDVTARRALIETVRPSHLLHLAWETRHGYYWEAPENLDWVAATLDLLGTFRRCGGARAVLAGTCAEYDWRPEALKDGVCCEWGTPRVPTTFYGKAKSATYELTAAFAERNGPSLAWARIFFAYGAFESENRLIPAVVRALLAGRPIPLGDGRMVRDLLDVRDVGTAVSTLLTSSVEGPVNIGSGIGISICEIAHSLAELIQRDESLLRFGALSTNPDEPARLLANATRLREEVGFRPRYDLRVGLADAVRWWKGKQQEGLQKLSVEKKRYCEDRTLIDEEFEERKRKFISAMAEDQNLKDLGRSWFLESFRHEYSYHFQWLGMPIIQYPQDIVALQEIIWRVQPDAIVETGIARGGSLIFSASMLELLGGDREVVGVDIDIRQHNRIAIEAHPLAKRVSMIEGSSVDKEVVDAVCRKVEGRERVLVILDSNHTHDHVLKELRLYSPLVTAGSYLIVFDTVVEHMPDEFFEHRPWGKGDNPMTAVHAFLKETDRFEINAEIHTKLQVTVAPDGYLRCIKD